MEVLRDYVWETDNDELQELIDSGYELVYADVSLEVIYEQFFDCFEGREVDQRIEEHFGYYGLYALLYVEGMHYWLMQV